MASHRKLDPDVSLSGEFSIPPEKGGKGFKVKADHIKYDVWQKPLSPNLPETAVDPDDGLTKRIRWLANYGLKLKGKGHQDDYEKKVDAYTIELDDEPGSKVVYFDGKNVQHHKDVKRQNGKVIITLDIGDPDTGYHP
jgi:hypothetical protein